MASFDFIFARANFSSDSLTALGSLLRGGREEKRLTMAPARNNERTVLWLRGRGSGIGDRGSLTVVGTFKRCAAKLAASQIKDDKKISLSTLLADGKVLQKRKKERETEREGKLQVENEKRCCKNNCNNLQQHTKANSSSSRSWSRTRSRSRRQSRSWSRRQSRSRRQRQRQSRS